MHGSSASSHAQPLYQQSNQQRFRPHSQPAHSSRSQPLSLNQQGSQARHRTSQQNSRAQAVPVYNPSIVRPDEVSAALEENAYGDRLCRVCSDADHRVYHHHVSTQHIRSFACEYQKGYIFYCIMCKSSESTVRPQSRKIILTSSTLFNVWTYQELKLDIHIEMESIVGGRVRDLTRALIMSYLGLPERLEIIVIAGLNNIGEGQAAEEIVEELRELKEVVKNHSVVNGHSEPGIVSISTLLYAPKFCALDNPAPNRVPPLSFINRRNVMDHGEGKFCHS